jgi:hypothetical protein
MDGSTALLAGYSVTVDGKEWKLSPFTEGVKKRYVAWLKADARASLYEEEPPPPATQGKPTEDEKHVRQKWDEERQLLNEAIDGKKFSWNSARCLNSLQTPEGIAKAVSLMIELAEPGGQVPPTGDALINLTFAPQCVDVFAQAIMDATPKVLRGSGPAAALPQAQAQ